MKMKKMMVGLGIVIILGLSFVLGGKLQGSLGALLLGIVAVATDSLWQILRMQLIKKPKLNKLVLSIVGGMLVRVCLIFAYLKFAFYWFAANEAYLFALTLLMIPLLNLATSFVVKKEGMV